MKAHHIYKYKYHCGTLVINTCISLYQFVYNRLYYRNQNTFRRFCNIFHFRNCIPVAALVPKEKAYWCGNITPFRCLKRVFSIKPTKKNREESFIYLNIIKGRRIDKIAPLYIYIYIYRSCSSTIIPKSLLLGVSYTFLPIEVRTIRIKLHTNQPVHTQTHIYNYLKKCLLL